MQRAAALLAIAFMMASCWPERETTGTVSACATELFHPYNAKAFDQCVEVCKKCDRGTTVTCTTSCTLKGAR
jgi:hypothetical protein